MVKKRLLMTFKTNTDRKISVSVDDPREDITEQEIKDCMDIILLKNIFNFDGENLAFCVEAKIVVTDTTEYDLIIG